MSVGEFDDVKNLKSIPKHRFFNIINKLFSLKVWNTKDLKTFIDKSLLLFYNLLFFLF